MKQQHDDVIDLAARLAADLPVEARSLFAVHIAKATHGLGLATVGQLVEALGCQCFPELVALFERYWVAVVEDSDECDEIEGRLEDAGVFHLVPLVVAAGNRFVQALAVIDEQPGSSVKH